MVRRGSGLLTVSLIGVLLGVVGCTGTDKPAPTGSTSAQSAAASSTATPARDQLLQALQRAQGTAFQYTVQGSLPEGAAVQATGRFDPGVQRFEATIVITGGKTPSATQRIVIGKDSYLRELDTNTWVHLDLSRVKPDSLVYFDMSDPTGLVKFGSAIGSVRVTGPNAYAGRFNPESGFKPFIPIGAPSLAAFFMSTAEFTATTDERSWITSLTVTLTPTTGAPLSMTTTMTGHGAKLQIVAPPKAQVQEAADFYYEK
jgi:hypothetical protein